MKKFKRCAYTFAAITAFALTTQSAFASPHNDRAIERAIQNAARQSSRIENQIRERKDRVFEFNNAASRNENRVLRMENRMQFDTARTINAMQAAQAADRATRRITNVDLSGLPADLNLRSRRDIYSVSNLSGNVTISRGGDQYVVDSNTRLTAAELAAVHQVLNEGGQGLSIGKNGSADGGSLTLDAAAVQGLSTLSIPKNVTVTGDFTTAQELNISGNLRNAGNFVVRTNDPSVSAATISASHIRNTATGNIATLDAGTSTLDLNLYSSTDIINNGNINGNGNVNISAGGFLINTQERGATGVPAITAGKNVSLQSSNIINNGLIGATAGNINIADQLQAGTAPRLVSLQATGGTFSAAGDITIGNNNFGDNEGIVLTGGDYYSNKLIINAGTGSADGIVGDVTGEAKLSAGIAHLGVSTTNLNLGQSVITGDPTFFNDAGNITITGDLVFQEAIAILASGDVTDGGNARLIEAVDGMGNGRQVTIIAGATLKGLDGAIATITAPGGEITAGFVQVGKATKTGGNVNLGNSNINTAGTSGGNGGDVTVIALAGKGGINGVVSLDTVTASGNGVGNNGNIAVYAGNLDATAIDLNTVVTGTGTGAAGNITLVNAQVTPKLTFDTAGEGTGSFKVSKLLEGTISTDALTASGGTISASSAGVVRFGASLGSTDVSASHGGSDGGTIQVNAGTFEAFGTMLAQGFDGADGTVDGANGDDGTSGGSIVITATGNVESSGAMSFYLDGGAGGIGANGAAAIINGGNGGNGGAGGNGGSVTITAGGDINLGGTDFDLYGGMGGAGGSGADGASGVTTGNGGAGGNGGASGNAGNVTMTADGQLVLGLSVQSRCYVAGAGGAGGAGGDGTGGSSGGDGGEGGAAGFGGRGGDITLSTTGSGNINTVSLFSVGGGDGAGGAGGNGGSSDSGSGGAGGSGGSGSQAGAGGTIILTTNTGSINLENNNDITSSGGFGANGGDGGAGGDVTAGGGSAGTGGDGGTGGQGGDSGNVTFTISKKGDGIVRNGTLASFGAKAGPAGSGGGGGSGGNNTGTGDGGDGGAGGAAASSGVVGSVLITTTGEIDLVGSISTGINMGPGSGGSGGNGGDSIDSVGGDGGNGGSGSSVSSGGLVSVSGGLVSINNIFSTPDFTGIGGSGGAGGESTNSNGGGGGAGGNGGNAGNGGTVQIFGSQVTVGTVNAESSISGAGGNGGSGGDSGNEGGNGGTGGNSGAGGNGGLIFITTKGKGTPNITVTTNISAAAKSPGNSGDGGNGGLSVGSVGSVGGNGGVKAAGGQGGSIELTSALDITLQDASVRGADGHDITQGGNGGNGGESDTFGGIGGFGATGSNGGAGGTINLFSKKGSATINGTVTLSGGDGTSGGNGGNGGDSDSNTGGVGGATGNGGSGGAAGSLNFNFKKGDVDGAGSIVGLGGAGGQGGNGGAGGISIDSTGGTGGGGLINGGAGGAGATVQILGGSISSLQLDLSGGTGGRGGDGGEGGLSINDVGGLGASAGNGGTGGIGGSVSGAKLKGDVTIELTNTGGEGGRGGEGGNGGETGGAGFPGGDGGVGGNGGTGGVGGIVNISTKGVVSVQTGMNTGGGAGGEGGGGGDGALGVTTDGDGGDGGNGGAGGIGGTVTTSNPLNIPPNVDGGNGGDGGDGGGGQTGGDGGNGGPGGPGGDANGTPGNQGADGSDGIGG